MSHNDFPIAGTNSASSPKPIARAVIVQNTSALSQDLNPKPGGKALAKIKREPFQNELFDRPLQEQAEAQPPVIPESQLAQQLEPINNEPEVPESTSPVVPQNRSQFALHGKCPVTLMMESKWVDGNKEWGCVHRGRTYLFSSQLHLAEFQKDPDRFSPLLAGYDPVIYHDQGRLVDGFEEKGVFMGKLETQRIILFSSDESRAKFQLNPGQYIDTVRQAMRSTINRSDATTKMR